MEDNFILKSKCDTFYKLPKEQSAAEYILRKCQELEHKDHPCVENPMSGESVRYLEIESLSMHVALFLLKEGFSHGDFIINTSHDGARLHTFFLGVWRVGGIIRCVYPDDVTSSLPEVVASTKPKFILCDDKDADACLKSVASSSTPFRVITFGEAKGCISAISIMLENPAEQKSSTIDLNKISATSTDVALLLPTSGTTGTSKAVIYTHEILLRNILLFENFPFTDDPSAPTLVTGKQTHFTGSVCPLAFFAAGRYLLMMTDVSQENIFYAIHKYKVKSIFSFPSYLTGLVRHPEAKQYDVASLEFAFTAGMVVGTTFFQTVQRIPKLKSIVTIYGMTEAGFLTANVEWNRLNGNIVGVLGKTTTPSGKLAPGGSLRVRDPDTGAYVSAGRWGELCFKSDLICKGYWRNEEASKLTFQDGWISTGDLGYYDEDGNVHVLNRIKEVFKYYNNHITPSELENVILEHPAVEQVCVIGVLDPQGGGTVPQAFVKLKDGETPDTADEISNWTNRKVADYKQLRGGLFIVKEFHKGKSGKTLRHLFKTPPSFTTAISD